MVRSFHSSTRTDESKLVMHEIANASRHYNVTHILLSVLPVVIAFTILYSKVIYCFVGI